MSRYAKVIACTDTHTDSMKHYFPAYAGGNDKGVKKEIDFEPDNAQSLVTVHLLYSHDSNPAGDPNNLTSHYDALVLRNDAPIS